jgi:hypothetical protein
MIKWYAYSGYQYIFSVSTETGKFLKKWKFDFLIQTNGNASNTSSTLK